ncbi:MAG: phage tail protein [Flavobacteriaceae bacterium]
MKFYILSLKTLKSISLIFLFTNFIYSQINEVGLSIQGIASNSSNVPIANATDLDIAIEIYTTDTSNQITTHISKSATVVTDAFGVFSYVLPISSTNFGDLKNFDARIKVSIGDPSVEVLNQKLLSVPYSIYAQTASNGVPVGAILPYTGDSASIPDGYLLCNGDPIPNGTAFDALRSLLGNNSTVPDLRGVFLRGSGSQTMTFDGSGGNSDFDGKSYSAGNLNTYDGDSFESHRHIFNMLTGSPKDDNQPLTQVPGTNRWELNYNNKVNPNGRSHGDLMWRLWDEVIKGNTEIAGGYASSANKVSDGGGKYGWIRGSGKSFAWGGDGPNIWSDGGSRNDKLVVINNHQHRFYGQTWYSNPTWGNASGSLTPGPTILESAPVWYNVNYIIKY